MSEGESRSGAGPVIHEVFPYLIVRGGAAAIDFYVHVFGAEETFKLADPSGKVGHAELRFGPATVMLADEHPESGILGPPENGGTGARIHLHVDDVDALAERRPGRLDPRPAADRPAPRRAPVPPARPVRPRVAARALDRGGLARRDAAAVHCRISGELMAARDPIVEEVRRVRQQHAARFDFDLDRIFDDLKRSEQARMLPDSPLQSPFARKRSPDSGGG